MRAWPAEMVPSSKRSRFGPSVAEKHAVCRLVAQARMMARSSFSKPWSRRRSPSSRTNASICERQPPKRGESKRSQSRPGVATRTSTPRVSMASSRDLLRPPTTQPTRRPAPSTRRFAWASICCASSRVGERTRTRTPARRRPAASCCTTLASSGSRKATVLPVPVWALATTSSEPMSGRNACFCTGVIFHPAPSCLSRFASSRASTNPRIEASSASVSATARGGAVGRRTLRTKASATAQSASARPPQRAVRMLQLVVLVVQL
mmetsp:Transcript_16551/g.55902  ORF Transcript_16551/g.55902 Transcript_16551/m.55902 type:complete len:264 (+) Transcript_16551:836-1627(+)